jgi:hypothetical protein
MTREYVGNRIRADFSSVVTYARVDLNHFIDVFKKTPPAMFRNRSELHQWMEINKLSCESIPGSKENIIRVHGTFKAIGEDVPYSQIWARASYRSYRKPWARYHAKADKLQPELLTKMHADHVINKERILGSFSKAWVMLFPVPDGSNSPFGSSVEKSLPALSAKDVNSEGYAINGLVGFKIFSMEYPRTEEEMVEQLKAVKGQVPEWFHDEVKRAIREVWRPKPLPVSA